MSAKHDERDAVEGAGPIGGRSTFVAGFRQYYRRIRALRQIERLIRVAPTATVRDDLMTIAARMSTS